MHPLGKQRSGSRSSGMCCASAVCGHAKDGPKAPCVHVAVLFKMVVLDPCTLELSEILAVVHAGRAHGFVRRVYTPKSPKVPKTFRSFGVQGVGFWGPGFGLHVGGFRSGKASSKHSCVE